MQEGQNSSRLSPVQQGASQCNSRMFCRPDRTTPLLDLSVQSTSKAVWEILNAHEAMSRLCSMMSYFGTTESENRIWKTVNQAFWARSCNHQYRSSDEIAWTISSPPTVQSFSHRQEDLEILPSIPPCVRALFQHDEAGAFENIKLLFSSLSA